MTFEELVAKSIEHAAAAETLVDPKVDQDWAAGQDDALYPVIARERGAIHATLSEAYARLASAVIVNRTSMNVVLETPKRGPVS